MCKTISIFGATGSIGQQTISLLKEIPNDFLVNILTANNNVDLLAKNAIKLGAKIAAINNENLYKKLKELLSGHNIEAVSGANQIKELCSQEKNCAVIAVSGFCGINILINIVKNCKTIGVANKESIVCAGKLIMQMAKAHNTTIVPLDSEHNAIMRLLKGNETKNIKKITITASGGPFLNHTKQDLTKITPKQSSKHPIWQMGQKISIDSSTMMNKCLEIIEASNIFNLNHEEIDAVIHPQALIHAFIEYKDSTITALMHKPNMKITLSSIITWPEMPKYNMTMSLSELNGIEIITNKKYKAIEIAKQAIINGGNFPITINAANEIAVNAFIKNKIQFTEILSVIEKTLDKTNYQNINSVFDIFEHDLIARQKANSVIESCV